MEWICNNFLDFKITDVYYTDVHRTWADGSLPRVENVSSFNRFLISRVNIVLSRLKFYMVIIYFMTYYIAQFKSSRESCSLADKLFEREQWTNQIDYQSLKPCYPITRRARISNAQRSIFLKSILYCNKYKLEMRP